MFDNFLEKKERKKKSGERARGLGRKTRQETRKGNQTTVLRFQTEVGRTPYILSLPASGCGMNLVCLHQGTQWTSNLVEKGEKHNNG